MSTIVNYKGNQLAIVNNGTATLNTKDTWVEDNIGLSVVSPTTTIIDTSTDTLHFKGGTIRDVSTGTAPVDESSYVTVQYGDNTIVDKSEQNCALTTKGTYVENDIVVTSNEPVTSTFGSRNIENEDGSTTREFEFIAEADRFFDPNYPSGDCVTTLEETFDYCAWDRDGITGLYAPNLTDVGKYSFHLCSNLQWAIIKGGTVWNAAFYQGDIRVAYIGNTTKIYNWAFGSAHNLEAVIITTPSVCNLAVLDAFDSTSLRGYNGVYSGHVYVPQDLIENYQTATNWSTMYASYPELFLPIEGSEYENMEIPTGLKNIDTFLDQQHPHGTVVYNGVTVEDRICKNRTGIKKLICPNATSIKDNYAFQSSSLIEIDMPNVTSIGTSAFDSCKSLKILNLPQVKTLGNYAFNGSGVEIVHLPELIGVQFNHHCFYECHSLKVIVFPKYNTYMHNGWAANCENLKYVDVYGAEFNSVTFTGCTSLDTIILRKNQVVPLRTLNALNTQTPFAEGGTGGKVYVPQDLISQYKVATNWSTLVGYGTLEFVPIEGSEYENFYADGTPIE